MASPDTSCAHMARTQTVAFIHLTAILFFDVPLPLSLSITNQVLRGVPLVARLCNYIHMTRVKCVSFSFQLRSKQDLWLCCNAAAGVRCVRGASYYISPSVSPDLSCLSPTLAYVSRGMCIVTATLTLDGLHRVKLRLCGCAHKSAALG